MIMRNTTYYLLSLVLALVVAGCRNNNDPSANEDRSAKKMLQGIWMDDENENAVFWAKGDSIFYPTRQVSRQSSGYAATACTYRTAR